MNNVTLTANDTGSEEEEEDYQYPLLNITSLDQCREAYRKSIKYIDEVIVVPYGDIQQDQEFFILAEEFARSTENPRYTKQNVHGECFHLIEEGKEVMRLFYTVLNLVRKLKANDSKVSVTTLEEIMQHLQPLDALTNGTDFDGRLKQACGWQNDFAHEVRLKYGIARTTLLQSPDFMKYYLSTIEQWYGILSDIVIDISFISHNMAQYLANNITKQELAEQFLSEESVTRREALFQGIKDMWYLIDQYGKGLYVLSDFLLNPYINVKNEKLVILNGTIVQRLQVVQKAATVHEFTDWTKNGNLEAIFKGIAVLIQDGPIKELNHNVTKPSLAMQQQLKIIETSLKEYQDSIKVDSHFYL